MVHVAHAGAWLICCVVHVAHAGAWLTCCVVHVAHAGAWLTCCVVHVHAGAWQAVCNASFGHHEANVACRQLGFMSGSVGNPAMYPDIYMQPINPSIGVSQVTGGTGSDRGHGQWVGGRVGWWLVGWWFMIVLCYYIFSPVPHI